MANERERSRGNRSALDSLPPLPAVALRVMQVAQDESSSAADLALVISSDPGLSARILRIVNSAAYRRSERDVTSVQEALVVLGFVQARNVAISSAITSAYAPDSLNAVFRISTFWRHSLAVAFKASELAAVTRTLNVPGAFTAGILHNMGRLAMFHADPEGLDRAVTLAIAEGLTLEEAEQQTLDYDHAELGGALAMRWRLPAEIVTAVARHHDVDPTETSLAAVVARADQFCAGYGLLPGYVLSGLDEEEDGLEVPDDVRRLLEQVDGLMELVGGHRAATQPAASQRRSA